MKCLSLQDSQDKAKSYRKRLTYLKNRVKKIKNGIVHSQKIKSTQACNKRKQNNQKKKKKNKERKNGES